MKRIFWWIIHLFNKQECWENSFMFYGVLFCEKCKRTLAYIKYGDEVDNEGNYSEEFIEVIKRK
jgi:hypothetical protein